MMRRLIGLTPLMSVLASLGMASGCTGDVRVGESDPGTTSVGQTGGDTGDDGGDDGMDDGPAGKLDVADPPVIEDGIPKNCAAAEELESTVGCEFFAVDLDGHPSNQTEAWGIAVSNVQPFDSGAVASVRVEASVGDHWVLLDQRDVSAGQLELFKPVQKGSTPNGLIPAGALRITSDTPITAYQFNPVAAGKATSDASMLSPSAHWDHWYRVLGAPHRGSDNNGELYSFIAVVASEDDTVVEITPSVDTHEGFEGSGPMAGETTTITLQTGDVYQLAAANEGDALTGTEVITDPDTPIAVFTAHRCGAVPIDVSACDHLEEQMFGLRQWGQHYVAARLPVRATTDQEPVIWTIYAAEDGTTVTFDAHAEVTGLPDAPASLNAGESLELTVTGSAKNPGDFVIQADKPVAAMQYAVGGMIVSNLDLSVQDRNGDPSMVQAAPVDQYMERFVVLAPEKWVEDWVVIVREKDVEVRLDDVVVDDADFTVVGVSNYEVARVLVEDGVHTLAAESPISVLGVGWDRYDSYAYLGGARTKFINEPQG